MASWTQIGYLLIAVSFMAGSCNSIADHDHTIIIPTPSDELTWDTDTVLLSLPDQSREFPYRTWSHNYSNPIVFAGFDERLHQINLLNTTTMAYEHTLPLEKTGPHGLPNSWGIGSIFYQSKDSIFILQNTPNFVFLLNDRSEIYWRLDIGDILSKAFPQTQAAGLFDMFYMYYHRGNLYLPLWKNPGVRDFTEPLIGRYNMESGTFAALDIHYPTEYQTQDFGRFDHPGITFLEDQIFVVFPALPRIYEYDLEGQLVRTIDMSSVLPQADPLKAGEDDRDHMAANPGYLNVQPVAEGKYFVQEGRKKYLSPNRQERESYTIVYDKNFTSFQIIENTNAPFTFGDANLYYPLIPDTTDVQFLERIIFH